MYIYIHTYTHTHAHTHTHTHTTDAHINAEDVRKLLGRLVFSGLRLFRCCGLFSFRSRVHSGFDSLEYPLWLWMRLFCCVSICTFVPVKAFLASLWLWTRACFAASVFVLLYH